MHINASSKIGLILFLLLIVSAFPLAAAPKTSSLEMPNVLVWISSMNPATAYVSVTFPQVIEKTKSELLLANILKETGWTTNNASITNDKPDENGGNPMTSIEFMPSQSVISQDGSLPIEPLVKALKDMKSIQVIVTTYPGFQYTGTGSFENKYVKLALVTGQGSYVFNVNIKDPNFQDPQFPKAKNVSDNEPVNKPGIGWQIIVIVILLAVATAAIVFFFMKKQQEKK